MINATKIEQIIATITTDSKLTTKKLNSYGLNSKDINKLIDMSIIKRISRGNYEVISVKEIYDYSKEMEKNGEYFKAVKSIEYAITKEPSKLFLYSQAILMFIKINDFTKAREYYINYCQLETDHQKFNVETNMIIKALLSEKKYDQIQELLLIKQDKDALTIVENYLLKITEKIINLGNNYLETNDQFKVIKFKCNKKEDDVLEIAIKDLYNKSEANKQSLKKQLKLIENNLLNNNIKGAIQKINAFLCNIGKEKYIPIILYFLDIYLIKGIKNYHELMNLLSYLIKNDFEYDLSFFLYKFYDAIIAKDLSLAEIYLRIIGLSKNFGINFDITNYLHSYLRKEEKKYNLKDCNNITEKIKKIKYYLTYINKINKQLITTKGLIILDDNCSKDWEEISRITKQYNNLECFQIPNKIVLKYHEKANDEIDYSSMYIAGKTAFYNGDYSKTIQIFSQILPVFSKEAIYYDLGISYMKLGDYKKGKDYLSIAKYLINVNGPSLNYQKIMKLLKK